MKPRKRYEAVPIEEELPKRIGNYLVLVYKDGWDSLLNRSQHFSGAGFASTDNEVVTYWLREIDDSEMIEFAEWIENQEWIFDLVAKVWDKFIDKKLHTHTTAELLTLYRNEKQKI